jgi:photosystem II stability/assembly factor-like uncharacterized protein
LNKNSFPFSPSTRPARRRLRYAFFLLLSLSLLVIAAAGNRLFTATTVEAASSTTSIQAQKSKKRRANRRSANARRTRQTAVTATTSQKHTAASTQNEAPIGEPTIGEEEEEGDERENIDARERWFMMQRAYPFDAPPAEGRFRAFLSRPKDAGRGKDGGGSTYAVAQTWRSIGPSPTTPAFPSNWGVTSGRINSIAIHPTNPQIILIGASTGGIWRSTDGGTNFVPVSDAQVDLAVGSIAFAKSNPSIVYAGMGDLGNGYFGTGVLKSTDAGATWTRVSNNSLPSLGTTAEIEVDPTNPNRVYVLQATRTLATSYTDVNPDNTVYRNGFYLSLDGGVNWQRTLAGRPRDLAIHPTNPSILYLGMTLVDLPGGALGLPGLYKSTDGGLSWLPVYTSPYDPVPTLSPFIRDVRVAVTPAAPENVYVLVGRTSSPAQVRLDISNNGGLTWTTKPTQGVDPGQFGYNSYIHVSPTDANAIYVGTRDLYVIGEGSTSWSNLTKNFVFNSTSNSYTYSPFSSTSHPDQHAFAFHPSNSNVIYIGNDGGISLSSDGGASFFSLNSSLTLTQFVSISAHPTDPAISYGGTQDNGTQRRVGGTSRWAEFSSGDGGRSIVNAANPSTVFTTYVYGTVRRYTNNGLTFSTDLASNSSFGEPATGQRIGFYPPMTGNGVDSTIYFGTWRLFTCTSCEGTPNWNAPAGTLDLTKGVTTQGADVLSAIGVQRAPHSGSQVIYTGSAQGRVMITQNGGSTWTDITAGLPNRYVESITVDPSNAAVAYVTFGGFGSGHVFRTTNSGASWTDIGGTPGQPNAIPNVPVSAFLIDPATPTTLYAGSDIGVFRSTDNGATWATFNNGMLPAVVTGFATSANGTIQLSTYGRGAYELVGAPTYTIDGRVTLFEGGAGLSGVTVTLANGQSSPPSAVTDANGNYTISNVPGGVNYVLGASKPDYTFSPQVIIFENLSANHTANFLAKLACVYSVSPGAGQSFPASGGAGSINMTTRAGCEWKALSLAPWITITSGANGTGNGTINFNVAPNSGNERFGQILHTSDYFYTIRQDASPAPAFVSFSAQNYAANEGAGRATVTVTRTGSTANAVSVDVVTYDDPAPVPCATSNGAAYARCDYATTIETVTFAAGDTQPKTVNIPLIDDAHVEQPEFFVVRLLNPSNTALGEVTSSVVTITDNGDVAGASNPILTTPLFVRMQYLDFLSREPEAGEPWSNVLNTCPNVNNNPLCDRILVSKSFFESQEFRLKGLFAFIFYRVAFNRLPEYAEIIPDMRAVTGQTASEVYAKRALFPTNFAQRPEFRTAYDSLSSTAFVNTLLDRYGFQTITTPDPQNPEGGVKVSLTRADLINRLGTQTLTRAQVLRAIVESDEIRGAEFNRAYVAMQYYGYLRRTPEAGGYNNWLNYLNANPTDARTMVNGFMNSAEYRARFGR